MKRYLVFDLDGTLVDSLPGIALAVQRSLARMQRPLPTVQQVRGMIGQGARQLCANALGYAAVESTPPDLLECMYAHFCEIYPHCWQGELTQPYAGVPAMLAELRRGGVRLAVLSNKPHEVTLPMVQQLFPGIFDPILGFTQGRFPRKPAPDALLHIAAEWGVEAAELTLVGDSLYDARTAQAAACGCVLVDWGYACPAELQAHGEPLMHSVDELSAWLRQAGE